MTHASAPADGPGALLRLIRHGRACTRADLRRATGLSRSTVSQRLDVLLGAGLVHEDGEAPSNGGRPPQLLAFDATVGVVLVADLGATRSRVAVSDLAGQVLALHGDDVDIGAGPTDVMSWVVAGFQSLLDELGRTRDDVRAVSIGLPGPVQFRTGRAIHPPIMPGWHDVALPPLLQADFAVPVYVDNDVNLMALGEYWTHWRRRTRDLLFVKVGTGIGSGVIADGVVHRGQDGTAGDMGHIRLSAAEGVVCGCGNTGCLEAVASGAALASALTEAGVQTPRARDVAAHVRAGDRVATTVVRAAGRHVGTVLAGVVNVLNPGAIVLGGDLASAATPLVAGVRELVYERSTVLATHDLRIEMSRLGDRAGVVGATVLATESILAPAAVDAMLRRPDASIRAM